MTFHYPDISKWQEGISLSGVQAVCSKASEGTSITDPWYGAHKTEAARVGAFFMAYHFLRQGSGQAQGQHAQRTVGRVPLMCDLEPRDSEGSHPKIGDATAFIDAVRKAGGICELVYFPKWYWGQIGSPSLQPFKDRKMSLVSSHYVDSYSDSGPGWQPYGGMTPEIWQYTDHKYLNGLYVDYNAFKGTLDQLRTLATGGTATGELIPFGEAGELLGAP
jgi:GH25 family lysozyme M1 (1,4-beta-N-acetylmuramidase)